MGSVLLCADDYGLTAGVSRGIRELAAAGRLSATSAIVTLPAWREEAGPIRELRDGISIGLHLNLTLGAPLGQMPRLAPGGRLPDVGQVTRAALLGQLDGGEIAAEIERQLDRFEAGLGAPPDHIDGHQHVHALPILRTALLDVLARRFARPGELLVRNPADRPGRIARRGLETGKAFAVAGLAAGFGRAVKARGFAMNDGFAGFSSFACGQPYGLELARAFTAPGTRHMVMCHPGHSDPELARLDPVVGRRDEELAALAAWDGGAGMILHTRRRPAGGAIDWHGEASHG